MISALQRTRHKTTIKLFFNTKGHVNEPTSCACIKASVFFSSHTNLHVLSLSRHKNSAAAAA